MFYNKSSLLKRESQITKIGTISKDTFGRAKSPNSEGFIRNATRTVRV